MGMGEMVQIINLLKGSYIKITKNNCQEINNSEPTTSR